MPRGKEPLRVFCSVAPEDESLCSQLHDHLRLLERQHILDVWSIRLLTAGKDWTTEIDTHLADASIILLLISSSFFASDYCYGIEMQAALRRHAAHEARVIPILLRPVDWETAPFAHLAVLPETRKFLTEWPDQDAFFSTIAVGIRRVIEELAHPSQQTLSPASPHVPFVPHLSASENRLVDILEAPHVEHFYGRVEELATLNRWIVEEQCRLLSIIGVGGIGKTSLAAKIVNQASPGFRAIFWRSLLNAPPFERFLQDALHFLTQEHLMELPQETEEQMRLLIAHLHHRRCLLILDNAEAILKSGSSTAEYKEGYEGYGTLIRRIGETRHQSCLVLTTREQLREIAWLEGEGTSVHSYRLGRLKVDEARVICERKGLSGEESSWPAFVERFSGNPMMLAVVSPTIRESYAGHIAPYLTELGDVPPHEYPDLRALLERQFERFAFLEQQIIYWLAIERVALSLQDVRAVYVQTISKGYLLTAIEALRRRSWIEQSEAGRFTLQPAIMDAVLDRFIERIVQEILAEKTALFASHALIKAEAKIYIRESQFQLILQVILQDLLTRLPKAALEEKLWQRLSALRCLPEPPNTYEAGNILNLLVQMGSDLRNADFSRLVVRQAYLQEVDLLDVNFAHAHLATSVFTDTFGGILSVAWNPQGDRLAAGTATGEIRIWDANGLPLQTFQGHTDWIWSVAFSPDGQTLVSGSGDQTVRLWEMRSGQCLTVLRGHTENVWSVAFSPDGQTLASGGGDQTVRLWEVRSGQCLHVLRDHTDIVRSVVFSPDSRMLASGSSDQTVRLWKLFGDHGAVVLTGHVSSVRSVAFSPDGKILATGSSDQTVRLWEMGSDQCVAVLHGHSSAIRSVVFSPDGRTLASGGFDQQVRLWEMGSGQCVMLLRGHTNAIWSVAFRPDGKALASGSEDQTVRLWETSSGLGLHTLRGHSQGVWSVVFSPDGEALVSGGGDRMVRLWEVKSGQCFAVLHGHADGIWSVAWSPNGEMLASGSSDQTVRLWKRRSGQCLSTLRGHTQMLFSVVFSPDGELLASGSGDQTVRLWDVRNGQCLSTLRGHTDAVRSVAFSPDGRILASGSKDQTIRLWDVGNGHSFHTLEGHHQWVFSVAFSPDGQILASGSGDQTVRLWDANSGEHLTTLQSATNAIRSVAFSHDGGMIVGGIYDGGMNHWDRYTGLSLRTLQRNRPYERMNITGVQGLTELQKMTLRSLGALEEEERE